eukprot:m.22136 g.22136  ORF g.22136 m.22136 type:complete len:169 (-) comp8244_c0_seq1:11-517(-)
MDLALLDVIEDMRRERSRSRLAAKRAIKIRSIVHNRVGALDVDLRAHVIDVLGKPHTEEGLPDVVVDEYSCSGILWKKGNIHHNWSQRWCLFDLRERRFGYYAHKGDDKEKGGFMLSEVLGVERINDSKNYPYLMNVITAGRTYHIRTDKEAILNVWLAVFDSVVPQE